MKSIYTLLLIIFSVMISYANNTFEVIKQRSDSIVLDSVILFPMQYQIEYITANGFRVIFKGGRKFSGLTFVDFTNDTLALITDGKYPSLKYRTTFASFEKAGVKNFQKNTVIKSEGSSQLGNFKVISYFSNTILNKIEVENGDTKYTFEFIWLRGYELVQIRGEQSGKLIAGFSHRKRGVPYFSIYHRNQPQSILVNFKCNGKISAVSKREFNNSGILIKETAIAIKK